MGFIKKRDEEIRLREWRIMRWERFGSVPDVEEYEEEDLYER